MSQTGHLFSDSDDNDLRVIEKPGIWHSLTGKSAAHYHFTSVTEFIQSVYITRELPLIRCMHSHLGKRNPPLPAVCMSANDKVKVIGFVGFSPLRSVGY